MRVFVTGGSGLVGGHVIEALRERHEVRAMARSDASARRVEAFGAEAVRCSLADIGAEHLAGCDAVVHAAAAVGEFGTDAYFWEGNVLGTECVLQAAREAGVGSFVHISSQAVLVDGRDVDGLDDDAPIPDAHPVAYCRTKAEAERRVLAADGPDFRTVALRPGMIWGPRDNNVLPALGEMLAAGSFSWIDGGRVQTVTTHVGNVVAAVERALEVEAARGPYTVADPELLDVRTFVGGLAGSQGWALPSRSVPGWLVRGAARLMEGTWRLFRFGGQPPITRMAAILMSRRHDVSDARIRRELAYEPPISFAAGIAELRT